jgi:peptidoglycan/LPS O-acetylase OafA/YrhL
VLFAAICRVAVSGRLRAVLLAILALASAAMIIAWSKTGMDVTYEYGLFRSIYGFAAGYLIYQVYAAGWTPNVMKETAAEVIAVIAVLAFIVVAGQSPISFAAPLLFAIVVLVFCPEEGRVSQALRSNRAQKLGEWSYSIYMVHALIATVFALGASVVANKTGLPLWQSVVEGGVTKRVVVVDNPWLLDALAILYLAIVIAVARLTYTWIEQPGRRMFNAWSDRISARGAAMTAPAKPS